MKVVDKQGCRDVACKGREEEDGQAGGGGENSGVGPSLQERQRSLPIGRGSSSVAGRGPKNM